MGKQTFCPHYKSANSWAHSVIANPQIFMINAQIKKFAKFTICVTTLSQNSLKSSLFKRFFNFVQILIMSLFAICVRRKSMHLRTCFAEVLSPQITKSLGMKIANQQSVTFSEGPQNLTYYLSPQICGPLWKLIWNELRFEQSGQKEVCQTLYVTMSSQVINIEIFSSSNYFSVLMKVQYKVQRTEPDIFTKMAAQ